MIEVASSAHAAFSDSPKGLLELSSMVGFHFAHINRLRNTAQSDVSASCAWKTRFVTFDPNVLACPAETSPGSRSTSVGT